MKLNPLNCFLLNKLYKNRQAITFDEVTFEDKPSIVHPNDVDLTTKITNNIILKGCGITSAAMDTVTEKEMALALAKMGGLGIIHRNLSIKRQCKMIKWVQKKIHYMGMIDKPITFQETDRLSDIQQSIKENGWTFTSFPIMKDDAFIGLITRNEMGFVENGNPRLSNIMIPLKELIVSNEITCKEAYVIMKKNKIKKLPIVDKGKLKGMYVWNDIRKSTCDNNFSLDKNGHFLVGAAVGLGKAEYERAVSLIKNGCLLLVIDTSHGACEPCLDMIQKLKSTYPDIDLIVGNIASYESAQYLLSKKYKPDAFKVGISIGSICTTRQVTAHGMPQLTAIYQVNRAILDLGLNVPIIADGGIRYSGDIIKALAVGASGVMMGSVFGGTLESPAKLIIDGDHKFKLVRGMGCKRAMEEREGSRSRYFNKTGKVNTLSVQEKQKVVPEGIEGLTKYRGTVEDVMNEFLGGVRSGLAHSGARTVNEFREKCCMWIQSHTGIIEGNPHSLAKIVG